MAARRQIFRLHGKPGGFPLGRQIEKDAPPFPEIPWGGTPYLPIISGRKTMASAKQNRINRMINVLENSSS